MSFVHGIPKITSVILYDAASGRLVGSLRMWLLHNETQFVRGAIGREVNPPIPRDPLHPRLSFRWQGLDELAEDFGLPVGHSEQLPVYFSALLADYHGAPERCLEHLLMLEIPKDQKGILLGWEAWEDPRSHLLDALQRELGRGRPLPASLLRYPKGALSEPVLAFLESHLQEYDVSLSRSA